MKKVGKDSATAHFDATRIRLAIDSSLPMSLVVIVISGAYMTYRVDPWREKDSCHHRWTGKTKERNNMAIVENSIRGYGSWTMSNLDWKLVNWGHGFRTGEGRNETIHHEERIWDNWNDTRKGNGLNAFWFRCWDSDGMVSSIEWYIYGEQNAYRWTDRLQWMSNRTERRLQYWDEHGKFIQTIKPMEIKRTRRKKSTEKSTNKEY